MYQVIDNEEVMDPLVQRMPHAAFFFLCRHVSVLQQIEGDSCKKKQ
jgi:hypothetical protein